MAVAQGEHDNLQGGVANQDRHRRSMIPLEMEVAHPRLAPSSPRRPQSHLAPSYRHRLGRLRRRLFGRDGGMAPLFPIFTREMTREFLQPISGAVLGGMTTINVLSSVHGQDPMDPNAAHPTLRMYLVSMPYTLFIVALAGFAISMAVARGRPDLVGFAAGFLLWELLYIIFVGSLVTIGRSDASPWIVWPVTVVIMVTILMVWILMCPYPECLSFECSSDDTNDIEAAIDTKDA